MPKVTTLALRRLKGANTTKEAPRYLRTRTGPHIHGTFSICDTLSSSGAQLRKHTQHTGGKARNELERGWILHGCRYQAVVPLASYGSIAQILGQHLAQPMKRTVSDPV